MNPMRTMTAFLPMAALVALASCSAPKDTGPSETYAQVSGGAGFGGETLDDGTGTNGTIVAVDPASRTIGIKTVGGKVVTYKAGPEVSNFALLKVGNVVQTDVSTLMTVDEAATGAPLVATNSTSVSRNAPGAPGGTARTVETVTGKVLQVDAYGRTVTLELNEGQSRVVPVMANINLADLQPGNIVIITRTRTRTFQVAKP